MDPAKILRAIGVNLRWPIAIAATLGAGIAAAAALPGASPPSPPARFAFADDFEAGLCTDSCPGAHWAIRQEERGSVAVVPAPGRKGKALKASASAKSGGVSKADVVARTAAMGEGTLVTVAFDLYAPRETPLNSIQLVDIECASCGEGGNPGVRLYLRRGRLRIDRSKIGIRNAWVRDDAPVLASERWHRVVLSVRIGAGDNGGARVTLDGTEVLNARGATILPLDKRFTDRVQIGVTANSNPVPVTLYFDNIAVSAKPAG